MLKGNILKKPADLFKLFKVFKACEQLEWPLFFLTVDTDLLLHSPRLTA